MLIIIINVHSYGLNTLTNVTFPRISSILVNCDSFNACYLNPLKGKFPSKNSLKWACTRIKPDPYCTFLTTDSKTHNVSF